MKNVVKGLTIANLLIALTLITFVSAVVIGSFFSPLYTYYPPGEGTTEMSIDNSTWSTSSQSGIGAGALMYVRFVTTAGYSGPATITWQLQINSPTWTDVAGAYETSTVTLTGLAGQILYATANGVGPAGNYEFASDFTSTITVQYRVHVTIDSP